MRFIAPKPGGIVDVGVLLEGIQATRQDVSFHLGISTQTLARYMKEGVAPRSIQVALFLESVYGRSSINASAHNDAVMYAGLADCLRREVATLRTRIARLERLGEFGSANEPYIKRAL